MNELIVELIESIKKLRMSSQTDTEEFVNKNSLLTSLKALAITRSEGLDTKQVNVEDLSEADFLETVKSKYKATRSAVIMIVSKSDNKEIGSSIAYIKKEDNKEIPVTYNDLTLKEIETIFTISPYLQTLLNELYFLTSLLPKQLTEEEIRQVIKDKELKSIKEIMPYFKQFYPGRVDNKLLSSIAKSI